MLDRSAILALIALAASDGLEAATAALDNQAEMDREGEIDGLRAFDEDGTGQDREGAYFPGCGADDTFDSKGEPLRPLVNDAGEPWWM